MFNFYSLNNLIYHIYRIIHNFLSQIHLNPIIFFLVQTTSHLLIFLFKLIVSNLSLNPNRSFNILFKFKNIVLPKIKQMALENPSSNHFCFYRYVLMSEDNLMSLTGEPLLMNG